MPPQGLWVPGAPSSGHHHGLIVPSSSDPYTKLLLHFDGSNGSAFFPDASGNKHDFVPTFAGFISTKQAKFGSSSIYTTEIQATGAGGVYGPASAGPALGSGDFVVECWHYPTLMPPGGQNNPIFDFGHDSTANSGGIWIGSAQQPFWINSNSGGTQVTGSVTAIPMNAWSHLAAVRSSGTTRFFVNGVLSGTPITDTTNYVTAANGPSVGASPAGAYSGPGYFDELRVSVGTDRGWSGGFTPPTSPYTSDAQTAVLLHAESTNGSLTFTDSSSHAYAFSTSSSIAVLDTAQSKFGGSSLHISNNGSVYGAMGDGSADLALGTSTFVVDFWFRPTSFSDGFPMVLDWGFVPIGASAPYLALAGSGQLQWYANNAVAITGAVMTLNTWYHVAIIRSGGVTRMFLNGVQVGADYTDTNNYAIAPNIGPSIGPFLTHIHATAGWYDEFRISKGTDRGWFSGFTPPSAPY